jgi:hypothetical protein
MLPVVLAGLLALGAPPSPSDGAPAAAPPAAAQPNTVSGVDVVKAPAKPQVVCRREAVLGSRMSKKVCEDAAAKAQRTADDRENLERIQTAIPVNAR